MKNIYVDIIQFPLHSLFANISHTKAFNSMQLKWLGFISLLPWFALIVGFLWLSVVVDLLWLSIIKDFLRLSIVKDFLRFAIVENASLIVGGRRLELCAHIAD